MRTAIFVWRLEDIGGVIFFALLLILAILYGIALLFDWLRRPRVLRRLFMCWWGGCGGIVDGDKIGVHWKCPRCGKITR